MQLTATQIKWIEEIQADEEANNKTLQIALTYHTNNENENRKQRNEFWKEMAEIYDLDIDNVVYTIKKVDGFVSIVEKEDDEDN